ncbi:MAG TPA: ubiquinone/menaquinone biosynthesis methyltransferase [Gemmatimonadaceae bacterium]|nr:ubiquinone/menaquinone biosynthesis methyltransferase [Gemmatimonadaceae bacterium]
MPSVETDEREARAAAAGGAEKRAYVKRIFSEIAPRYDLLNHLLSLNIDRRWRTSAIAALGWERRADGVYLDLCAGTMDLSVALASRNGFEGAVVAADFAEPMLRAGRDKVARMRVHPVAADALQLPFSSGRIAGALVAFGIRNVMDLDAALRELKRVIADDGTLVILEFSTPRSRAVRLVYHAYFHVVLPLVGRLVSGHPTAYRYLPRSVASFPVEEELALRIRRAGFAAVSWRSLTFGIAALHVARIERATAGAAA